MYMEENCNCKKFLEVQNLIYSMKQSKMFIKFLQYKINNYLFPMHHV